MKKLAFLVFPALLFTVACNKQPCTPPDSEGIVGKWKLVEIFNGNSNELDYFVTFDSMGRVYASDFPCAGTYSFDENREVSLPDGNLVVEFNECSMDLRGWNSIQGEAMAHFMDSNTLIVDSVNCDEGCAVKFKRVCD